MTDYTDTDEYQAEIAEQYKQRKSAFSGNANEAATAARTLGVDIKQNELVEATTGNVSTTYLTSDKVIKVNRDKKEQKYYANVFASKKLSDVYPVVRVLAYDFFEKTDCEILIMERLPGTLLLHDIFDLSENDLKTLFSVVLAVARAMTELSFDSFGRIKETVKEKTYVEYLNKRFDRYINRIRRDKLCSEQDATAIENYFKKHVPVFENEHAVLVHDDLHMGNILHQGSRLTGIIDFDSAVQAPKVRILLSVLGFIGHPSQYVEGTPDFPKYQNKDFYYLLPLVRKAFPDLFSDPRLLRKLNIIAIGEGIMWVAGNWSTEWNKEMIKNILAYELAETEEALKTSYFGKILAHL